LSQYQKGNINLDFTEARDSEWQWHQLGHMQVCTSLQTDNHASTPPLSLYSRADLYRNRAGSFTVTFMSYHCTVAELSLKNNVTIEIWVNFLTFFSFSFYCRLRCFVCRYCFVVVCTATSTARVCVCVCLCMCVCVSHCRGLETSYPRGVGSWSESSAALFSGSAERSPRGKV